MINKAIALILFVLGAFVLNSFIQTTPSKPFTHFGDFILSFFYISMIWSYLECLTKENK